MVGTAFVSADGAHVAVVLLNRSNTPQTVSIVDAATSLDINADVPAKAIQTFLFNRA